MGDYNALSGRGLERICALSDGLFAVAMTLIVLELKVPSAEQAPGEAALQQALAALAPRALTYLLSFLTLGIFWVGQQTQLNALAHSDRDFTWLSFLFLAIVAVLPFSTELLAEHTALRTALAVYWLNILALGGALYLTWRRAVRGGLIRESVDEHVRRTVRARIVRAQILYAAGAALCLLSPYVSIAFIVAVQLNYALGSPVLRRITT